VEHDRPGIGSELAVEHVEQRRLACAVRPDDGDFLAGIDREREFTQGMHAAVGFAKTIDDQDRRLAHVGCRPLTPMRCTMPARPSGKKSTSAITTAPTVARQNSV